MRRLWQNGLKRVFDVVVAAAALAALWPLLLAIGAAVKLSSPGPVFYRGERIGRHGKRFKIWKFRSMCVDGETAGGTTTGLDDPRVTPVGALLRAYKLDELPQVFNVLRGDMSLVGPRPEVEEYVDAYVDGQLRILSVRPGITDWSSLEFHDLQQHVGSADPDRTFREYVLPRKNELRVQYVLDQSFTTDMTILYKTARLVLGKPFQRNRAA